MRIVSTRLLALTVGLVASGLFATAAPAEDYGPFREQKTKAGDVLADTRGMTLYTYDKDGQGQSACTSKCAGRRGRPPRRRPATSRAATSRPLSGRTGPCSGLAAASRSTRSRATRRRATRPATARATSGTSPSPTSTSFWCELNDPRLQGEGFKSSRFETDRRPRPTHLLARDGAGGEREAVLLAPYEMDLEGAARDCRGGLVA